MEPASPAAAAAPLPLRHSNATAQDDVESPAMFDRWLRAAIGGWTGGISPVAVQLAHADWLLHLLISPAKWTRLLHKAARKAARLQLFAAEAMVHPGTAPCIDPLPQDHRFDAPAWQRWPYSYIYQAFLLHQQWWHNATTGIAGVTPQHEQMVNYLARQWLDMFAPANFLATNPELVQATLAEGGANLWRGWRYLAEDLERRLTDQPLPGTEQFRPGQGVALTPGKVVWRNRLIELIQYAPSTPQVWAEPMLIVPAWIMKYYILDLSTHNSLVRYLVDRGHTVFMISWHNPAAADGDLDMDAYLRLGVYEALKAIAAIVPGRRVNGVGYCLGGTLLAIAAACRSQAGEDAPFHSLTLLAAQTDFQDAGELRLYADHSQLDFLDNLMWSRGYLAAQEMAGTFRWLRSNDLIWSRLVREYLMGRREPVNDLAAWNADATRMPYRMHSEYLHRLLLRNELAEGRYQINGRTVQVGDIAVPLFVVATEADHVAPWRSVYRLHMLNASDLTFVLTSGGHNAGIVSEPGHPRRHFRIAHRQANAAYVEPNAWLDAHDPLEGSWWGAWAEWLAARSEARVNPPSTGAPDKGYPIAGDAPGKYVHER